MTTTDEPTPPARMEPPQSAVSAPFWDATRDQRILIQWCGDCGRAVWYPRHLCPHCASSTLEWREVSGHGVVYAVSVQYRPGLPQLANRVPYAVVLVDLVEGVRMMSNVFGSDPERVAVGDAVVAAWEPLSDGRNLLVFEQVETD